MSMLAATKLLPVADASTLTVAMLCDPPEPLETFRNQLIDSLVINGYGRCTHAAKLMMEGENFPS